MVCHLTTFSFRHTISSSNDLKAKQQLLTFTYSRGQYGGINVRLRKIVYLRGYFVPFVWQNILKCMPFTI